MTPLAPHLTAFLEQRLAVERGAFIPGRKTTVSDAQRAVFASTYVGNPPRSDKNPSCDGPRVCLARESSRLTDARMSRSRG